MTLCREGENSIRKGEISLEPPAIPATATTAMVSDADGDGADDATDRCKNTPDGIAVDEIGCPQRLVFDERALNFEFDSAALPAEAARILWPAVRFVEKHPSAKFVVTGHTDKLGSRAYNQRLSLERAQAVRNALVSPGLAANRLEVRGEGETAPLATNATDAGRARNRRVEIVLAGSE